MITTAILTILYFTISTALYALETNTTYLPVALTTAISNLGIYVMVWDAVFPVTTILQILALYLSIELLIQIWKLTLFGINLLRGTNL